MDERRKKLLEDLATKYGTTVEILISTLDRLESRGEIGFELAKKIICSKLEKQLDARSFFRMIAQELEISSTDEYIEVFPNIDRESLYELEKKFRKYKIKNDRLQQRNIMLSPEIWHTLLENQKEVLTDNIFKQNIDTSKGQVVFSELLQLNNLEKIDNTISHRINCDALILRTIQFDFLNTQEDYESGSLKKFTKKTLRNYSSLFDKFLKSLNKIDYDSFFAMAENCLEFSIHEYYLPYGLNKKGLEKAVLLFRYDHSGSKHKNSVLPKYYNCYFPSSVSDPHFHFNEGLGQIYKLLTRSGQKNYGSGYAIDMISLFAYIEDLKNLKNLPEEQRRILENNDFGMPFLNMVKNIIPTDLSRENDQLKNKLVPLNDSLFELNIANALNSKFRAFETAYKIFDIIDGVGPRNIETFRILNPQDANIEQILSLLNPNNNDNTPNNNPRKK